MAFSALYKYALRKYIHAIIHVLSAQFFLSPPFPTTGARFLSGFESRGICPSRGPHITRQTPLVLPWSSDTRFCAQVSDNSLLSFRNNRYLYSPLSGPTHQIVRPQQWRRPKQDLILRPPEGIEDCCVEGASEGILAVCAQGVGRDTFLLWGAEVAPPAHVSVTDVSLYICRLIMKVDFAMLSD